MTREALFAFPRILRRALGDKDALPDADWNEQAATAVSVAAAVLVVVLIALLLGTVGP
jgi:hypothetical protein